MSAVSGKKLLFLRKTDIITYVAKQSLKLISPIKRISKACFSFPRGIFSFSETLFFAFQKANGKIGKPSIDLILKNPFKFEWVF